MHGHANTWEEELHAALAERNTLRAEVERQRQLEEEKDMAIARLHNETVDLLAQNERPRERVAGVERAYVADFESVEKNAYSRGLEEQRAEVEHLRAVMQRVYDDGIGRPGFACAAVVEPLWKALQT